MRPLLFSIFFFYGLICYGQFSISPQYHLIPVELNPSLSGSACGLRAIAHYQNRSYLSTNDLNIGVSVDMPIHFKNGDKFGGAYHYYGDYLSDNIYTTIGHQLSVSYHKNISGTGKDQSFIALGASIGVMSRHLELTNLRWPSQITPSGFDPNIDPGESFHPHLSTPNINVGLSYYGKISTNISTNTGVTINHINRPNVSFLENTSYLQAIRSVFYTRIDMQLSKKWHIMPSAYYTKMNTADYYMFGSDVGYQFNEKYAIAVGGGYAKNDQFYVNLTATIQSLTVGLNYQRNNNVRFNQVEALVAYIIPKTCK